MVPTTVTCPLVLSMLSNSASPTVSRISMFPAPAATGSSNVITNVASMATSTASSAGASPVIVGCVVSTTVAKFQPVASPMPGKSLVAKSVKAPASTRR